MVSAVQAISAETDEFIIACRFPMQLPTRCRRTTAQESRNNCRRVNPALTNCPDNAATQRVVEASPAADFRSIEQNDGKLTKLGEPIMLQARHAANAGD
jgi:hypothetical protein